MASEAPYAALSGLFWAGLLAAAARAGRENGAGPTTVTDVVALGVAGAKIGKVVAEDRVTVFLRRPFADGPAAVQPEGRRRHPGGGRARHLLALRLAVGCRNPRRRPRHAPTRSPLRYTRFRRLRGR